MGAVRGADFWSLRVASILVLGLNTILRVGRDRIACGVGFVLNYLLITTEAPAGAGTAVNFFKQGVEGLGC